MSKQAFGQESSSIDYLAKIRSQAQEIAIPINTYYHEITEESSSSKDITGFVGAVSANASYMNAASDTSEGYTDEIGGLSAARSSGSLDFSFSDDVGGSTSAEPATGAGHDDIVLLDGDRPDIPDSIPDTEGSIDTDPPQEERNSDKNFN
jgi:hypothetical protein